MATCPLIAGFTYTDNCSPYAGGATHIAFVESVNLDPTATTITGGVITAMALASSKVFRVYKVKPNKSFATDVPGRSENGAPFYTPQVTMNLADLGTVLRAEIQLHMKNYLCIAWRDAQKVWRVCGYYTPMEVAPSGNDANFGTVLADGHKHTIVYTGLETVPMLEMQASVASSLNLPIT